MGGRRGSALALVAMLAGCSGAERREVRLERVKPDADPDCGAPDDARNLVITALGEFPATEATARSVEVGGAGADISIEGFPPGTNSLEVEVRGFGGAVRAVGRTPLFALDQLEDGAVVPVFMAPLDGFCPTGPPGQARDAPLAVRVDRGVLVAGGSSRGRPVDQVELYDPATGQFSGLGAPLYGSDLEAGLAGASMTALPDGRVVVAGGGATAYQVYDPAAGFGPPQFLREARAFHAAVALGEDRLLFAAGCARLEDSTCAAGAGLSTSVVLTVSTGELADGPGLSRLRVGGRALREADGRVLLIGGVDGDGNPVTDGERIDPDGGRANELVAGTGAAGAILAGGGALTGFAPLGAPASQSASVVPPGATSATEVTSIEPRAGPALAALEGGGVLVVGGSAGAAAALYAPAIGALEALPAGPGDAGRSGAAAVLLADGSVLVIGGVDGDGEALADAWIFRPELAGPWSGGRSATFATPQSAAPMVPRDPARARRVPAQGGAPAHYRIEASGEPSELPSEWAILAGPAFTSISLEASVAVEQGGAAILLWFRDEARSAMVALEPGQPAALRSIEAGRSGPLGSCTGEPIAAADLAPGEGAGHQLAVDASAGSLVAVLDGRAVLRCQVEPPAPGLVGVAPLGGEGAALRLDLISASR